MSSTLKLRFSIGVILILLTLLLKQYFRSSEIVFGSYSLVSASVDGVPENVIVGRGPVKSTVVFPVTAGIDGRFTISVSFNEKSIISVVFDQGGIVSYSFSKFDEDACYSYYDLNIDGVMENLLITNLRSRAQKKYQGTIVWDEVAGKQ